MSHDALGTLTDGSGEAHAAASAPPMETKSTAEQRPSKSEKGLSRYGHTDSTWAEALPLNAHVKFVKDTLDGYTAWTFGRMVKPPSTNDPVPPG